MRTSIITTITVNKNNNSNNNSPQWQETLTTGSSGRPGETTVWTAVITTIAINNNNDNNNTPAMAGDFNHRVIRAAWGDNCVDSCNNNNNN